MDLKSKRVSLIKEAFGSAVIEKDGINVCIKCPKCGKSSSNKKKLVVKIDDGKFHCWVCGFKGAQINFLFSKYAPSFLVRAREVFKTQIRESNIEELEEEIDLTRDLESFVFLGDSKKYSDPDVKAVFKYAVSRGITLEKMWRYRLGTVRSGRLRRRLIIPSFDAAGEINYYCAREINRSGRMKYINAPVAKSEIVFNEFMIDWSRPVTLVEGPLDLVEAGNNSVCLLGSHLSEKSKLSRLLIKNSTTVFIALDHDARDKAEKIASFLMSYGNNVMMVNMPGSSDISDMGEDRFLEIKKRAKQWSDNQKLLGMISRIKSGSII